MKPDAEFDDHGEAAGEKKNSSGERHAQDQFEVNTRGMIAIARAKMGPRR